MSRRPIRKLERGERRQAQYLLADGIEPKLVAKRLGVDVRSLNGLLDSPVSRELSDRDRFELVFRHSWVQYERSVRFADPLADAVEDDDRDDGTSTGNSLLDNTRTQYVKATQQLRADASKHLKTALDAAEKLSKLGSDIAGEFPGLSISINGTELGDRPTLAGEAVSGDDGNGGNEDADD